MSQVSPATSIWTNPTMGLVSSTYIGRASAQDCHLFSPSSWRASLLRGAAISGSDVIDSHAPRHTQLLHALSSSSRHVSSDTSQSCKYPGTSSQDVNHPIVRYSASSSSASCGLPGCSTAYDRSSLRALDRAVPTRPSQQSPSSTALRSSPPSTTNPPPPSRNAG